MSFTAFNAPPTKAAPTIIQASPSSKTTSLLQSAFADRPDILQGLKRLALSDERLIQDISNYVLTLKQNASAAASAPVPPQSSLAQASKKRKLEEVANRSSDSWADRSVRASHIAGDVSFSVPQRKKLRLEWVNSSSGDLNAGGIRAMSAAGDVEFGVSWKDIDQIFSLPVPEKTKRQHNFIVIPQNANGLLPIAPGAPEPILWTVFEPGPKEIDAPQEPSHTTDLLNKQLQPFGKKVIFPDSAEFESAISQAHRKGEPAYHVKAHRGSKDGYLYFLPPGILFAFKKPLLFLPFSAIESISYTSVLQRTFNLNITISAEGEQKEEEIEFSMLDQADFPGIDEYIKNHGLNDASLAAGRRAKKYDVNKAKGAEAEAGNGVEEVGEDGLTELQRAEQMLQDEEDEEEEDYVDEGSEEGSGSEDDDSDGDEGMADANGADSDEDDEEDD